MENPQSLEEKVKKAQEKANQLGHCLCDLNKTCPCVIYQKYEICKCARMENTLL